jgi:hypothetical protein
VSTTKTFHLGDVLSVTTGLMLSPTGMDGIYEILNWMTGENLMTHQLPRAGDECIGPLLAQHPDLAEVQVPAGVLDTEATYRAWMDEQVARFGETREVAPLGGEEHAYIDPVTELRMMMRPDLPVVVVDVSKEG